MPVERREQGGSGRNSPGLPGSDSEAQGRRREAESEGSVEQKREPMYKNRI
jgi:hypothetical protein